MSDILEQLTSEFLASRALSVNKRTYLRDVRVLQELFAAVHEADRAGGGVTSLGTRGGRETTAPWDGPMTNLEVDLVCAAMTAMVSRPRDPKQGNTAGDVGFTLRQLGRWMGRRKSGGLNELRLAFLLNDYPARFTLAKHASPPTAPPRLHLVRERPGTVGDAPAGESSVR